MRELFRESGVVPAPEQFTREVMDQIREEPEKTRFKPLVGRSGRILILLLVVAMVLVSVFYSKPNGTSTPFQLPDLSFDLQFLSEINFSTGLLAALAAVLILMISDAGFRTNRFA